jgi:hypothetical protein
MGLIDDSHVTGIEEDQGSDGKNTNQVHEDLKEDGVEMIPLSFCMIARVCSRV